MKIIKQTDVPKIIRPYLIDHPTIIEVGAFKGNDTVRLASTLPEARIYAFEPVPELYNVLVATTTSYPNVTPVHAAVSNHDSSMPLHVSKKPNGKTTQASSLQKPKERLVHSPIIFPETIIVPTVRL